uniref:Uncharacterized protein n=1 Tax=Anopheles quadriannulatus TaxID=34691 RepID=A0A182XS86_ANOQN
MQFRIIENPMPPCP